MPPECSGQRSVFTCHLEYSGSHLRDFGSKSLPFATNTGRSSQAYNFPHQTLYESLRS